jgi:hypothetical protein
MQPAAFPQMVNGNPAKTGELAKTADAQKQRLHWNFRRFRAME